MNLAAEPIYWIGGSPCSGKSTVAEMLVAEFGFQMVKCDDHLDRFMEVGASNGSSIMQKFKSMNLDQTWLRPVEEQVDEEFQFYREAAPLIVADLERYEKSPPIVVEGAAITPEFVGRYGIDKARYIAVTPSKDFQLEKYRQREWVPHYLSGCSDPAQAFAHWMERDVRFAETVRADSRKSGLFDIVVDGSRSVEDIYEAVKRHFGL